MNIKNVIKYYRDCFVSDNRKLTIDNFFSSKVENKKIVEGTEELLNNLFSQTPIDEEFAEKTKKIIAVYEKEKSLIYCSLFIIGKEKEKKTNSKICAPLVYFQADIEYEEGVYYLRIDKEHPTINFQILKNISEDFSENDEIHNDFIELFSKTEPELDFSSKLINLLEKHLPELQNHYLLSFPDLFSEKEIKKHLHSNKLDSFEGFVILPASGIGIVKKSTETLGIINELENISKEDSFSVPLKSIFFGKKIFFHAEKRGEIPAILNSVQEKIIENFPIYPFSLIIGPPGTGKSFTLANLAIEQMSKGKSVLICSKTDQAVNIVADKIENQLKINEVIVRAGRKEYLKELKIKLQNILNNAFTENLDKITDVHSISQKLKNVRKEIINLENEFSNIIENEIKWGNYLAQKHENPSFFDNLKIKYKKWRNSKDEKLWAIISEIQDLYDRLNYKTIDYIEKGFHLQLFITLKNHRAELQKFQKGISSRTGAKQADFFSSIDFKILLKTFPIWLVKFSDIYKVLPLQKELFDVAIIDEATQCDIASCIPIIQRAKKVVFTGDPHQLRHVSFISFANQDALKQKYKLNVNDDKLNYRENSILDVVNSSITDSNQVFFLDEHFRSLPAIIDFSNKNFYSNALKIMTNRPENVTKGLEFIFCKGIRNKFGFNEIEANKIIEKLLSIISEDADLEAENCRTIGILSPFRAQVDYISNKIFQELQLSQIQKHKILINTAYGFQGDERDIMLISFCLDNNSHSVAFHHLNKNDVFNVSITRARTEQIIFYSFDIELIKQHSLLKEYFAKADNFKKNIPTKTEKDKFALEVIKELSIDTEIKIHQSFNIAGLEIDLLINKNDIIFGIDLIGYPGNYNEAFSIERYKLMKRTGIKIIPLPYSSWIFDRQSCVNELFDCLK